MLRAFSERHPTMAKYDPASIEPKWQAFWAEDKTFKVGDDELLLMREDEILAVIDD